MWRSPRRLTALFALATVTFAGTGWINYKATQTLLANERNQAAQRLTATELQNLLGLALMAETGQRGFIITGREDYLAPYEDARKKISESIGTLRSALAHDPQQLRRVAEIESVQRLKLEELARSIDARRQQGFAAAQEIVLSNRGKQLMDRLQATVAEMDAVERAKSLSGIQQSDRSAEQAIRTIAFAGALDIGLLLLLFLSVQLDKAAREEASRNQANAEALLRNVIDSSPALIYVKDLAGKVVLSNEAFRNLDLVAAPWPDEMSGSDLEVVNAGASVQFEEKVATESGARYLFSSKRPLRDHLGNMAGVCAVSVDVTSLKNAEAEVRTLNQTLERRVEERTLQLHHANDQLQDANGQLEAFSYTVAHDLRAPLRGMQGFAQAVSEDYAKVLDATGQDYLRRILRAAARMERLIEDLLSLSRLSRVELRLERVALDRVLDEVTTSLASQIEERHAQVEVPKEVPTVTANYALCVQVLQNLIANAIKFTPNGKTPRVTITAGPAKYGDGMRPNNSNSSSGHYVRIAVRDEGIGIAAPQLEKIFKPFERLHGVDEYRGSGIGLAIVDKAVRRMHGRLGVVSEPGQGSCFWIELPIASPSAGA